MNLGAFSISLPVKDLAASADFYRKLGFDDLGGDPAYNYLIMRSPEGHIVGLFQGMFEQPMLTFNPGWDQSAQAVDPFNDVRELHKAFTAAGVETSQENGLDSEAGPASFVVMDPDGNPILFDQHR